MDRRSLTSFALSLAGHGCLVLGAWLALGAWGAHEPPVAGRVVALVGVMAADQREAKSAQSASEAETKPALSMKEVSPVASAKIPAAADEPAKSSAVATASATASVSASATVPGSPKGSLPRNSIVLDIHPHYPRAARAMGEEGEVRVRARIVIKSGSVSDAVLTRPSGFARLDQAALEATRQAHAIFSGPPPVAPSQATIDKEFVILFRLSDPLPEY